jgi:hypothetical protein
VAISRESGARPPCQVAISREIDQKSQTVEGESRRRYSSTHSVHWSVMLAVRGVVG